MLLYSLLGMKISRDLEWRFEPFHPLANIWDRPEKFSFGFIVGDQSG